MPPTLPRHFTQIDRMTPFYTELNLFSELWAQLIQINHGSLGTVSVIKVKRTKYFQVQAIK